MSWIPTRSTPTGHLLRSLITKAYYRSPLKMAAAASTDTPNAFTAPVNKTAHAFDKVALEGTLARRFFFTPAFEIYGGVSDASDMDLS